MEKTPTKQGDSPAKKSSSKEDKGVMYDMLKDPLADRKIKDLPLPPNRPVKDSVLFQGLDAPDLQTYI